MAIYTHGQEEQWQATMHQPRADNTSTANDYYLVRVERTQKTVLGISTPREDVHYYRLKQQNSQPEQYTENKPFAQSPLLDHYNRVNNVMFGQLDPYYWPALRRRAEAREARAAEAADETLPPAHDARWEQTDQAPFRSPSPIAAMQRCHSMAPAPEASEVSSSGQAMHSRENRSRPPFLLLSTMGILGAVAVARILKAKRRLTWARADARAWRKMAMQLVDQPSSKLAAAMPQVRPQAQQVTSANAAKETKAHADVGAVSRAKVAEDIPKLLMSSKESAPTVQSKTAKVANPPSSSLHPHEDWDWTPADFPPRRPLHWRRHRLPPWCIGFSSVPKVSQEEPKRQSIQSDVDAAEQGSQKKIDTEDESFIVEILRDVYGIDTQPADASSAEKTGEKSAVASQPLPASPPAQKSRIDNAIQAHKTNDVSGEGSVLSTRPAARPQDRPESMAYDHEELVREVHEAAGRARRQRLRSRLAMRLAPERSRLVKKPAPSDVLAEQYAQDAIEHDDDDESAGFFFSSDYLCAHSDQQTIVHEINAQLSAGKATSSLKRDAKRPRGKDKPASATPLHAQHDIGNLERQVWALMARVEALERRK